MIHESETLFEKVRGEIRQESGTLAQRLVWNGLGMTHLRSKNYVEAESIFRRALECKVEHAGISRYVELNNLGVALWEQGRTIDADPLLRQAIELAQSASEPDHFHAANAMKNLGRNYQSAGNASEAAQWYHAALKQFELAPPTDGRMRVKVAETRELIAELGNP